LVYQYNCPGCRHRFDVVKPVKDIDRVESCERCGAESKREFVPRISHFIGTKVQHAEYNPGLGCVVRNKDHRRDLCKARGLEEIGNEKVDSVHKYFDTSRDDKWEKGWDAIDSPQWVGNGQSLEINTGTNTGTKPAGGEE
jgi:putative FmdB family regulatory protein